MNRKKLSTLILSAVLVSSFNTVSAHNAENGNLPEYDLNPTVVTATKTPVKAFDANANINVITAKEIEQNHFQNITQALATVPGVFINNYGPAGYDQQNAISINGSNKVVVLIDGVKMDNPQIAFLGIESKDMSNIAKIEVLKGSASTLYGANAQGGVISITTKKPMKNVNSISVEGGNFGVYRGTVNSRGREGNWSYSVSLQKAKSGDYRDGDNRKINSDSDATNSYIAISNKLSDKNEITARYSAYHADYKFGGFWEKLKNGNVSQNLYSITLKTKPDDYSQNTFIYSQNNYRGFYQTDYDDWKPQAKSVYASNQYTNQLSAKNRITTGIDYQKTSVDSLSDSITTKAIYIQDEITPADKWKFTLGTRLIHNNYYGHKNNSAVNIGYHFDDNNNMYVSYSEFFTSPTLDQLVGQWGANPNLKPESGHTKEIGFNHRFDAKTVASMHYFKRYTENKISYVNYSKYENIGTEHARGWDMQLKKMFDQHWSANLGYTFLHADANENQNANANGYIPKHAVNIGVNFTDEKWESSLIGYGAINRPGPKLQNDEAALPNDRYWKWDLSVNYKADKDTKLYMVINNIFDKYYASYSNVAWGAPGQWWSMPGRAFIFGVEHNF